ncbi:fluoride efflux transporter CrcB [Sphingomonas donggukensis]|uniref:Fluoride-specific ion channel FluC n=1 Tax=Sphingomonas donggukensis TaxID=2949093 RepID=A0ABY4TSI8_9SPHN|nr:fluoride efflux transporter CrcB [Sphingomonas donggukensis]URW74785.1 fluoride efflux transporter CrcB [Sphingomonas donggukensis]
MSNLLFVMAGGAIGAGARHLFGRATLSTLGPAYPWGTLGVNLIGGLLMGLLVGTLARTGANESARLFLGVGVLGGFTTFSAFSLDAANMLERGALVPAGLYVAASVIGSIVALFAGLALARSVAA